MTGVSLTRFSSRRIASGPYICYDSARNKPSGRIDTQSKLMKAFSVIS